MSVIEPRVRDLMNISDAMHSEKSPMLTLWQEIAENFYPERADFTSVREAQSEWADHLHDSFPVMARRELGDAVSSMLRPRGKQWFSMRLRRDEMMENPAVKAWCGKQTKTLARMVYDPAANFVRSTKTADHDFVSFGNAVLTCEDVPARSQLLFSAWHIRDVAWAENWLGKVDRVDRKAKMTLRTIKQKWPKTFPDQWEQRLQTAPGDRVEVRHIVMPREDFERSSDAEKPRKEPPFVELYVLCETQTLLAENDLKFNPYVIPRWHLTGASPYAYSSAAMAALPDARQSQALALLLREAGEKMIDPPMLAVKEALRSDLSLMAGTLTWVDAEYDERSGEAARPLQDISDIPAGLNMRSDLREMLSQAWMLNKLQLPAEKDMTAYETARRMEEYVRAVVPLFEPLEHDYNAQLLDLATQIGFEANAFGRPDQWPEEVQGQDIEFAFENAIQQAQRERSSAAFTQGLQLIGAARQFEPQAGQGVNVDKGLDAALEGVGWDAAWNLAEGEKEDAKAATAEEAGTAKLLALAGAGGGAMKDMGAGAKALAEAGMMEEAA